MRNVSSSSGGGCGGGGGSSSGGSGSGGGSAPAPRRVQLFGTTAFDSLRRLTDPGARVDEVRDRRREDFLLGLREEDHREACLARLQAGGQAGDLHILNDDNNTAASQQQVDRM
jgi:hypothetical protein